MKNILKSFNVLGWKDTLKKFEKETPISVCEVRPSKKINKCASSQGKQRKKNELDFSSLPKNSQKKIELAFQKVRPFLQLWSSNDSFRVPQKCCTKSSKMPLQPLSENRQKKSEKKEVGALIKVRLKNWEGLMQF